jgi:hypothetical protein
LKKPFGHPPVCDNEDLAMFSAGSEFFVLRFLVLHS